MSTLGIAHHQRGTLPVIDTEAERESRMARYADKDAAYRAALRLRDGQPLPGSIGQVSGGGGPRRRGYEASVMGGRIRRRMATQDV